MGKPSSKQLATPKLITSWESWPYRIGCPVWGCKAWSGQIYPLGTATDGFLSWYSHMLPTVEGNSTFYSVPGPDVFRKWADTTAEGFQFCFKFPRSLSHDSRLIHCGDIEREWLDRLRILHEPRRLGPTFLQLAPSFSSRYFEQLAQFLARLPTEWAWAVEVRHPVWFDGDKWEMRLNRMLEGLGIDRVIFDSRPLNAMAPSDQAEAVSQERKPKVPVRSRRQP